MQHETGFALSLLLALMAGEASAEADPAAALAAACTRPAWSGELPEALVATEEQMLEAQRSVKAFDRAVAEYGECLAAAEARLAAEGADAEALREARIRGNDGAVGEAERLAAEFNARLRDWRARSSGSTIESPRLLETDKEEAGTMRARPSGRTLGLSYSENEPPRFLGMSKEEAGKRCYSDEMRRAGTEARSIVPLLVDTDGRASVKDWPPGLSEDFKESVLCVASKLRFAPGTADGRPVPSEISMPFNFALSAYPDMPTPFKFEPPVAISTDDEMRQAQAECAPPGFTGRGEPGVELKVSAAGRVSGVRIVQSSGDPAVDRLAECIIGKTRFAPGRRNGAARHMTMTTTVTIGAPASAPRGAGQPPATGTTPP